MFSAYRAQYANNRNIPFMPAITSTSSRMHGEFLRLLFGKKIVKCLKVFDIISGPDR